MDCRLHAGDGAGPSALFRAVYLQRTHRSRRVLVDIYEFILVFNVRYILWGLKVSFTSSYKTFLHLLIMIKYRWNKVIIFNHYHNSAEFSELNFILTEYFVRFETVNTFHLIFAHRLFHKNWFGSLKYWLNICDNYLGSSIKNNFSTLIGN